MIGNPGLIDSPTVKCIIHLHPFGSSGWFTITVTVERKEDDTAHAL